MDTFHERSLSFALVSGVAEVFWLVFAWKWGCVYFNSPGKTRFPLHAIALIWLFARNLFYTINIIYELLPRSRLSDVNWVCFSLYMTLTYFTGFTISLGFGTTHLRLHWMEWTLVTCVSGVTCLASFLEFLYSPTLSDLSAILTFSIFGAQLIVTYLTVKNLLLEYQKYQYLSVSMLTPLTYMRYRTMTIYCLILTLLFVTEVLEAYLVYDRHIDSGSVYLWLVSTIAKTIVDSITLWLTRPRKELLSISSESGSSTEVTRSKACLEPGGYT